ncbi:right-handed parallel beta-helix repeat-containing protein [uncultured Methanobrevibacter sp.]|uniref:right-handed parallel beta-helix repeat-containing protein n=1 Tax=uncultured Methanobrevibacter sp. TaxID=253161 RepID=UPI002635FA8D
MRNFNKILLFLLVLILSLASVNAAELDDSNLNDNLIDNSNDNFGISLNEAFNEDLNLYSNDLNHDLNSDSNELSSNSESNSLEILNDSNLSPKGEKLSDSNQNIHKISDSNYSNYFDRNGNLLSGIVSPNDILDLSGSFKGRNFILNVPCTITSSSNNAFLTNCMIKFEGVNEFQSNSSKSSSLLTSKVYNLNIRNSNADCPGVYILNSSYVEVFNNDIYCTGANGNPVRVIYSNFTSIFGNVLESYFTGYMNLSWKRAGILLGESHNNSIYSNQVTVKDSNPIYLTTYGFEKSNYNFIYNNTVKASAISEDTGLLAPSAWAYGIHIMGDYNTALNNTIYNMYRGVDSEGSFNNIIGNIIFNLTGGYFEGNDGTEGGDYGIHASYDNLIANNTVFNSKLTGSAIYLMPNNTAYGNIVYNISGRSGIEFNYYASNCDVYDNLIYMARGNGIYVFGRMSNLTVSSNIVGSLDSEAILFKRQSNSKYPNNSSVFDNSIFSFSNSAIDISNIPSNGNITVFDNGIIVDESGFSDFFASDGTINNLSYLNGLNGTYDNPYNALIFEGNFSNALLNDGVLKIDAPISLVSLNCTFSKLDAYLNRNLSFLNHDLIGPDLSSNNPVSSFSYDFYENDEYNYIIENFNALKASTALFNNISLEILSSGLLIEGLRFNNGSIALNNVDKVYLINNHIYIDFKDYAIRFNNSNASLFSNFIEVNEYNPALLIANESVVVMDENIIKTLSDIGILCINSTYPKSSSYVIDDSNYYAFFNDDGSFRDDFEIDFNSTLKLANLSNKIIKIDIPLRIVSVEGSKLINSRIIFEGESFNSVLSNLSFEIRDNSFLKSYEIISVKEGVGDLLISNNRILVCDADFNELSFIRVFDYEESSENIKIINNSFYMENSSINISKALSIEGLKNSTIANNNIQISSNKSSYGLDLSNSKDLTFLNNDLNISSINSSYALAIRNSKDLSIRDNNIFSNAVSSIGLGLYKSSDFEALNNNISIFGSFYNALATEDPLGNFDGAILIDSSSDLTSSILENNLLFENGLKTSFIHSENPARDIQNLIDDAIPGDVIDFGNTIYANLDTLKINKSLTIKGGVFVFNESDYLNGGSGGIKVLFNVSALDEFEDLDLCSNGKDSDLSSEGSDLSSEGSDLSSIGVNILNGIYILNNNKIIVLLNGINGSDVFSTNVPKVNVANNIFSLVDEDIVAKSINILQLEMDRAVLAPSNSISVLNNTLSSGINPFKMEIKSILDGKDVFISPGFEKGSTFIECENMTTSSINYYLDGRNGEYFNFILLDGSGNPLANKPIFVGFNGHVYNYTTDENGSARTQINLAIKGGYTFAVSFLGDDEYNASFAVAKITVNTQIPILATNDFSYKASNSNKVISASLKTALGTPLSNKKIVFAVNGKTYSTKTNAKGIGSLKLSLASKKTYKFTVKFAGDSTYGTVSKSAKIVVK